MVAIHIYRVIWFIGLILLQVLICNKVHLFGYATPFLYIYFIFKLDSSVSANALMLWGGIMGIIIDGFSNTLGMNTAAIVLLAFLRPFLLRLFVSRDNMDVIVPSSRTMGKWPFGKYLIAGILIHHAVLLSIEFFSFTNIGGLLFRILLDSILTFSLIIAIDGMRNR
ncbi:MAG: hypothetical protein EZS26_003222 [Candidatus Ordinivivax streblomastigis]|uniref:Uncharacterized protein n=1 Tax=Candidatus Ordinivivax streblomastigis TaxID=2540710 RepID=A0A5M8NWB8_9BACT|nr:MAG: hypothetical protein EZS26_003222 [Candidatus Ordinivivax streblomastigis]